MSHDFGAIVIGAGPGGYPCAIRLGQLGVKTLVIEKEYWGGVCLNVGCIPSKALIGAAKRYEEIKHAGDMGFVLPEGEIGIDVGKLQGWKDSVVTKLTGGVRQLLKANGVEMMEGTATLAGPNTVKVATADGEKTITAGAIVIATGSSPIQIPGFAYADERVIDSTGALALQAIPKKMVVIGGGYIGLEMSGVYSKLGTEVTVVEMMDQILPGFDPDVVKVLARRMKKEGVTTLLKTRALGWEAADDGIVVNVESDKDGKQALPCDYVLVTVGRFPNTKGIGLEETGIAMNGRFIQVDRQMRTNVPSVYAIGDAVGGMMLAHKATHEGEVAAEVIAGHTVQYDAKTVPAVVFTDPEVATAGKSEPELKAEGVAYKVGKVPWAAIGKAIANGETEGFVKVLIDAESHLILGVTICGYHASDIISEAALAIEMCAEALDVGLTIHPHPTLGEAVMEAAKAALGEAIHVVNR
ncbi:MAG: dihydrolipoyl dehydrogenase [Alphaproteobacteria bacterium]|nr:dihydrolipoyl dehydrogenase [Alphaproteobacteria bacterium]MCB9694307.1 dihydrolipoyl dehydrogenase [Alphaproteobacteria bacterium]